ncbi:MAG TPA: MATE family efflux transporter [Polyangiaceae bacterium]|jgi:putative MATE family efflux protein|nr:MATE family efflux transporter [Polyangiaceae bacterium]
MSSRRASDRIVAGPLAGTLARFGAPLALGMALQTTFNLVDAYVISRLDPDIAGPSLGAIGICDQIAAVGSIVSYGIATATAALVAQYEGRGDREAARHVAWQSLILVSLWSALFGVLGLFGAGFIMRDVVGAKGQVAEFGAEYLRVILGGSFSIFFLLQVTAIQRALGSSKTPVAMLLLSNVLNLVLAVLLVYGPGEAPPVFAWGPPVAEALHLPRLRLLGAAWATILARTVTLCPLLYLVIRRFGLFRGGARGGIHRRTAREILTIAWPSSTQLVLRILAMLAVHALVARHFTTQSDQSATTALGIVFRLETMALFVGLGWGSAAQTFVAQNLGAGQEQRAARSGWFAALYNVGAMALLVLLYRRFGASLVMFFDENTYVVTVALGYLAVVAPSYPALGLGIVLGSAMTGAGATRVTMLIDLAVICIFQLPFALAATSFGAPSMLRLWLAVAVTNVLSAAVYAIVYRKGTFLRHQGVMRTAR